jgi:predicted secreted protein
LPTNRRTIRIAMVLAVTLVLATAGLIAVWFYLSPAPCGTANASCSSTTTAGETTTLTNGLTEYIYPTANLTSLISARVNETFIVQLSSNAGSTGYDWKITTSAGMLYLNYSVVSTSANAGGPQVRDYYFRALLGGNQTIDLRNERLFAPYTVSSTIHIQVPVIAANGIVEPTMISYNFQTNSTSGTLFVVWKNYGSVAISIAKVYFDQVLVNNSSMQFGPPSGSTCGSLKECELTIYFGGNTLPLPSQGDHILRISTSGGDFQYTVTTGTIYHAGCTYTESC